MAEIAGYRLVSVRHAGGLGGSWFAEAPGRAGVVVEVCRPEHACEISGGADALSLFLARRALQRRLAKAIGDGPGGLGHGHVVPLLDLGVTDTGGYAVRPRYDLSAGDLLRAGVSLRADVLLELVSGVVSALRAIGDAAGRPHGDLDPDSILLDDMRPGRLRVGLTNPALPAALGDDLDAARREDLRRLGLLIYELVVRRPFRELGGYPVRDGGEWQSLGPDAGFWLGLVNALLDPKDRSLTLEGVASRLGKVKYRKPGPGPLMIGGAAAAAVVLVAGVAVLLMMPRGGALPDVDFRVENFRRWCEVSPGVQAFREEVESLGGSAPGVLSAAAAALEEGADKLGGEFKGMGDFFDPNAAIEKANYTRTTPGTAGLASLVSGVERFQQKIDNGEEVEGAAARLKKLNRVAGVYTLALERLDGDDDRPGFVAMFDREHWPSRETVESVAESWKEHPGWARAAGLIEADLKAVDDAADTLRRGVPFADSGKETATIGVGPVQQAAYDAVRALVAAVMRVERAAEWAPGLDGRVAALRQRADELRSHAKLEGLDRALVASLGDDPLLDSLPTLIDSIGVLDDSQGLDVLRSRLDAAEKAFDEVQRVVDGGWDDLRVDVITMRDTLGDRFDAMKERVDPSAGAGAVSAWVDERIGLCGDWTRAADASPAYPAQEAPAARLKLAETPERLGALWAEAVEADRGESENLSRQLLDAAGENRDVDSLLGALSAAVDRVRAGPAWPSRREQIDADLAEASRLSALLSRVVEDVNAFVLQKPEELIAEWRAEQTLGPGVAEALGRIEALRAARETIAGGMVSAWEKWRSSSNLDDEQARRAPETRAFRVRLKGFEGVLSRAVGRVLAIPDPLREVGGFEWAPIEPAAVRARAEAVASVLGGISEAQWADREASLEGGEIDRAVAAALAQSEKELAGLNEALGRLAGVRTALDGCMLPGEDGAPEAGAVSALLGSLDGPYVPFIAESDDVRAVMSVADEVLSIASSDDLGSLLARAEDVGPDEPHRAARYAALRRVDELANSGQTWPTDVGSMREEADRLGAAVRRMLEELGADADAKARVETEVGRVLGGWWRRGFGVARDEKDLAVLVDEAPKWWGEDFAGSVGDLDTLDGRAQYDARTYRVRQELTAAAGETMRKSKGATKDQAAAFEEVFKGLASTKLRALRALADRALDEPARRGALKWIADAERAIAEAQGGRAGWDENEHGPVKLAGWRVSLGENADGSAKLTYTNGTLTIVFDLIELPDRQQVFLAEDEFSVDLLEEVLRSGDVKEKLKEWFAETARTSSQARPKGPMAESIRQRGRNGRYFVGVSEHWLDDQNPQYGAAVPGESFPAYPAGLVDPSDPVAISPDQGRPSGKHPVTYVTFRAAKTIAAAMGCRLPTAEEFGRALALAPYPPESGVWNLRDATTFPKQLAHYQQAFDSEVRNHYKPGDGCYDKRARQGDDGASWVYRTTPGRSPETRLWFDPTGPIDRQQGVRFRHLIGNVAEFVTSNGKAAAMGCSALSHPSVKPDRVVARLGSVSGYADTGFRLAIDADDFGSLARSIERLIEQSTGSAYAFGGG